MDVQTHFTDGVAIGFRRAEFVRNMGFELKDNPDAYSFANYVKEIENLGVDFPDLGRFGIGRSHCLLPDIGGLLNRGRLAFGRRLRAKIRSRRIR